MLKNSLLFRNLQTSRANNSKILRIKNAKFSGHWFYMKTIILRDFQICISVPLKLVAVFSCQKDKMTWKGSCIKE